MVSRPKLASFVVLISFSCLLHGIVVQTTNSNNLSVTRASVKPKPLPTLKPLPLIPAVPKAFSFKSEIVQPSSDLLGLNLLRTAEQWFSAQSKLTRVDYVPLGKGFDFIDLWDDDFGQNPLSIVHDFNTGHAYIMDKIIGNCTIQKIELGLDDSKGKKQGWLRMLNASEFFDLTGANFKYMGRGNVGDVIVDTWHAERSDWPEMLLQDKNIQIHSDWTWKFLEGEWLESSDDEEETLSNDVPYQLELNIKRIVNGNETHHYNYTFNYYDFSKSPPLDWEFDIRQCSDLFSKRATLGFSFPGNYSDIISDNFAKVKEMILFSVRTWGDLKTPVRVSEPKLSFEKNVWDKMEVQVVLEILDIPPGVGNVENPLNDTPVEEACSSITDAVNEGTFKIVIVDPKNLDQSKEIVTAFGGYYQMFGDSRKSGGEKEHHFPCSPEKTDLQGQTSDLPKLPDKYQTTIEMKNRLTNELFTLFDYYDYNSSRRRIDVKNDTEVTFIYDYDENEVLCIRGENCVAVKTKVDIFMNMFFPFFLPEKPDQIPDVNTILEFANQFRERRLENETIRNILCEHYVACIQHQKGKNIFMASIDWWFSSSEEATPVHSEPRLPVRMHVKGATYGVDDPHKIIGSDVDIVYDFVSFIPFGPGVIEDDTDLYETPPSVFCENKNQGKKKYPKPPKAFSFKAQVTSNAALLSSKHTIKTYEYWYDYQEKLFRMDHRPVLGLPDIRLPRSNDAMREVHDFKTGIAYIQDLATGSCKIEPIQKDITDAKEIIKNGHRYVEMQNATEFFHFEGSLSQYVGKRKDENGVLQDVWIAIREDWPPKWTHPDDNIKFKTTWEWTFLSKEWTEMSDNEENSKGKRFPYHLALTKDVLIDPDGSSMRMKEDFNIYDFTPVAPQWYDFDISLCYDQFKEAHFTMSFPENHKEIVFAHLPVVKNFMLLSIVAFSGVGTNLRISNILFDFEDGKEKNSTAPARVVALFTILGVAPVKGDAKDPIIQVPLDEVKKELKKAVESKIFVVVIPNPNQPDQTLTEMHALNDSFKEVDRYDTRDKPPIIIYRDVDGYTGGELAGLGIGLAILGVIIGAIIGFLVFRKNGVELPVSFAFRKDTGHGDRIKIIPKD